MWFIQIEILACMVEIVCIFFTKSLTHHLEWLAGYHCFREFFFKSAWILILYTLNVKSKSLNFRLKRVSILSESTELEIPRKQQSTNEPCPCLPGMFITALNGWWRAMLTPLCHPACTFIRTRLPRGRLGWDKWSVLTSWSSPTTNWMIKATWVAGLPDLPPLDSTAIIYAGPAWRKWTFLRLWHPSPGWLDYAQLFNVKGTFSLEAMPVARVFYEAFNRWNWIRHLCWKTFLANTLVWKFIKW